MFYFRARKRESRRTVESRVSTLEDKLRRHKNKERIWRRATARLAQINFAQINQDAASLKAAS